MFVNEGLARIKTGSQSLPKGPGKAGMGFYNSSQKLNRDLAVMAVSGLRPRHYLDAFGGTGIRGIRVFLETGVETFISEKSRLSCNLIRENISTNECSIPLYNGDFSTLIREVEFDFIDVDPYGSVVPYLDDALTYLRKPGYLGITATDLSALTGSVPRTNLRRYGCSLTVDYYLHEAGIRNLLGYIARRAAAFDLFVKPILSFWKSHFYRVIVRVGKGARDADSMIRQVGMIDKGNFSRTTMGVEGPIWKGNIEDRELIDGFKIPDFLAEHELQEMINLLMHEDEMLLFFDTRDVFHGYPAISSLHAAMKSIEEKLGKTVYRTHFSDSGLKVKASLQDVIAAVS